MSTVDLVFSKWSNCTEKPITLRKRGRPPKVKPENDEGGTVVTSLTKDHGIDLAAPKPTPKKRARGGREAKVKAEVQADEAEGEKDEDDGEC